MVLIDEPAAKAPPDRPRVLIDELFDNGGVGAGFEACGGCTHTRSTLALSNLVQNAFLVFVPQGWELPTRCFGARESRQLHLESTSAAADCKARRPHDCPWSCRSASRYKRRRRRSRHRSTRTWSESRHNTTRTTGRTLDRLPRMLAETLCERESARTLNGVAWQQSAIMCEEGARALPSATLADVLLTSSMR